ncbi:hypothetical protein VE01_00919 [Pseudogymnoascus verrucosus]|uniref:Gfd2/YDR514C-like C-terminal domain-containing protein n=1 Tax=Pseudogymnoascus verrucosus TaxID=342668 RepID=A0A2P2SW25_9PEZI|nr:uncharacterized protein VE01_00919 [Pseudogymnoascus verrucosus]OBU01039.2 hypothetical protein VE01_00919 [Pseudogymnoascus verrucosus]
MDGLWLDSINLNFDLLDVNVIPLLVANPWTKSHLCFPWRLPGPVICQRVYLVPESEPELPAYDLETGELAPAGHNFVPLKALEKYHHTYVEGANRYKVNRNYFDKQKFYTHEWDFFYIYPPPELSPNASVLVPLAQVEHFIWIINRHLKTHLGIPIMERDPGFIIDCPNDGTPRPRYIGRSNDYETAVLTKKAIPSKGYRPPNEPASSTKPSDESLEAFKERMEEMLEMDRKKKQALKTKKQAERYAKQQGWNHVTKRVQRYLGLRERQTEVDEWGIKISAPSPGDGLAKIEADLAKLNIKTQIDVTKPAPFEQESSVVFICVDIEAYEKNHRLITEIGIATLDTADITNISPEERGTSWFSAIRARHFRIKEYGHLNNTEYLQGCADMFRFGTSEWIKIADAPKSVADCFKPPFSNPLSLSPIDPSEKRKIVLVGHDLPQDIAFLRQLGYDPGNLPNLLECTDTAHMYRAFRREPNNSGLGKVLADLDIAGWDLHNAGNDAVYTLQAMVAIAVKALVEKQDIREREKEVMEQKIKEAMEAAAEVVRENKEGWSSGGEDSDGGIPGPPLGEEKTTQQHHGPPGMNRKENSGRGGSNYGAARGARSSWRRGSGSNLAPVRKPAREGNDAARSGWW